MEFQWLYHCVHLKQHFYISHNNIKNGSKFVQNIAFKSSFS